MAYLERRTLGRRLTSLGTAGMIELAIGAALIAGLSVTVMPEPAPPQIDATNIPDEPLPPPPEDQPKAKRIDDTFDTVKPPIDLPTAGPTTDLYPTPAPRDPGYGSEPEVVPTPQPSTRLAPVSAAPRNAPAKWVTTDDYPARDLREGNQGVTQFRLSIGADGRVERCEVTRSSGFASLDQAACARIMRRARFAPATDESGAKVPGTYSSSVRWQIPN